MLHVTPDVHAAESRAWQSAGQVAQFADYLERVLEVGCGTGVFLARLAEAVGPSGQVIGVDHAAALVEQARQRSRALPSVRVEVADAYRLPYPDGAFDVAHCERLLIHLDDPVAALREMRRVVRPGGRVVVGEPAWSSLALDHPDAEAIDLLTRQVLARGRAQSVLDDLVAASADGTFFGCVAFFLARGERGTMAEATTRQERPRC